eukprot:764104-Hanusia_phi.AAC.1
MEGMDWQSREGEMYEGLLINVRRHPDFRCLACCRPSLIPLRSSFLVSPSYHISSLHFSSLRILFPLSSSVDTAQDIINRRTGEVAIPGNKEGRVAFGEVFNLEILPPPSFLCTQPLSSPSLLLLPSSPLQLLLPTYLHHLQVGREQVEDEDEARSVTVVRRGPDSFLQVFIIIAPQSMVGASVYEPLSQMVIPLRSISRAFLSSSLSSSPSPSSLYVLMLIRFKFSTSFSAISTSSSSSRCSVQQAADVSDRLKLLGPTGLSSLSTRA